jgi:hypothetical protein
MTEHSPPDSDPPATEPEEESTDLGYRDTAEERAYEKVEDDKQKDGDSASSDEQD